MAKTPDTKNTNPPAPVPEVPEGFTKLYAPEGFTGCWCAGRNYEAENGTIVVPAESVADLLPHGLSTSPIKPQADA